MTFNEAKVKCKEAVTYFSEIQLVYGRAGLSVCSMCKVRARKAKAQESIKTTTHRTVFFQVKKESCPRWDSNPQKLCSVG